MVVRSRPAPGRRMTLTTTLAHVPFHVVSQHVQEDVPADVIGDVDPDRADLQIALGDAEGALHGGEALVGLDSGVRRDVLKAGADDVDPVEAGLPVDPLLTPARPCCAAGAGRPS